MVRELLDLRSPVPIPERVFERLSPEPYSNVFSRVAEVVEQTGAQVIQKANPTIIMTPGAGCAHRLMLGLCGGE